MAAPPPRYARVVLQASPGAALHVARVPGPPDSQSGFAEVGFTHLKLALTRHAGKGGFAAALFARAVKDPTDH